jgi:excinuclease ABC subunit C
MKRLNLKDDTGLNNPFSDCMLPDEIIVQGKVSSPDSFSDLVKSRTGKNIKIRLPRGKMRKKILDLAQKNAEQALDLHVRENEKKLEILRNLTEECGLRKIPVLIECYDISNIQGTDAYGSMAVFRSGIPCKKEYRCFKIRQKQTPDDYMMMEEVLSRRFSKDHFSDIPDLVVIDGGIAHLGIAEKVLSRTGNDGIDVIAIAKERRNEKPERIYIHGRNAALIPENQDVLHMLMRIRDEAHRFALRLHRKGREKTRFVSPLDNIPGMGKKRKKALMLKFGSLKNIMEADVEELASVKQINKGLAERIHEFFHGIA